MPSTPPATPERFAGFWSRFDRVDGWLLQVERAGMAFAAVVLALVFAMLMAGVFGRPWSGTIFSVALETGSMSMWSISYMGAAFIWRTYGHVQFDLFLRMLRGRAHHLLQIANNLAALFIGVCLAWYALDSFLWQYRSGATTQNLRFPYWPAYWPAFLGLSILAVELVFSTLRNVRELVTPTGSEEAMYGDVSPPAI